ncbi:hypothetical protein PSPTOT1_2055 [Pseudomonas syringae pv. tomato T1]|nr:hypothetical protein PSPTOT1_2055 [Pseudomonas syringae pv. tomato T1]
MQVMTCSGTASASPHLSGPAYQCEGKSCPQAVAAFHDKVKTGAECATEPGFGAIGPMNIGPIDTFH